MLKKCSVCGKEFETNYKGDKPVCRNCRSNNSKPVNPKSSRKPESIDKAIEKLISDCKKNDCVAECGKGRRKSKAKAAGLKSALDLGNGQALITSFGKGNEAVPEKRVEGDKIISLREGEAFALAKEPVNHKLVLKSGRIKAEGGPVEFDGPQKNSSMSAVRLDEYNNQIERKFFRGNKVLQDNIRIQIAHNIMDIEKILAVHINNIVYSVNNLFRVQGNEGDDFLGYRGLDKNYSDFCKNKPEDKERFFNFIGKGDGKVTNPRLSYYGAAFAEKVQPTLKYREAEDIYYIICMLGEARQMFAHGNDDRTKTFLYNIAGYRNGTEINSKLTAVLDGIYSKKVEELNGNFIKNSKKDLTVLFSAFGCPDEASKKKLIEKYYDFIVKKTNKNMGFSVTKLREKIIEGYRFRGNPVTGTDYDSVRHKLYRTFDFIICSYYDDHADKKDTLVSSLRASLNDTKKENLYAGEAKAIAESIKDRMDTVCRMYNKGEGIKHITVDRFIAGAGAGKLIDKCSISTECDYFCKFIYLMTLFIDGKEINDLLTTLINKFDNIDSLTAVYKGVNNQNRVEFGDKYDMFNRAGEICESLRSINSFARMESPAPAAKRTMFVDAIRMFGFADVSDNDAEKFYKENIEPFIYDRNGDIEDEWKKGKLVHKKDEKKKGVYNFIATNVIESNRFQYLVRYANTEKIAALARNETIVRFVIKKLPAAQIVRYYIACNRIRENINSNVLTSDDMAESLVKLVTGMDFGKIKGVRNDDRSGDKEMKKAIVTLYLTILYHLTKNLVYVNSRYFMAFHCLERDMNLFGEGQKQTLRDTGDYPADNADLRRSDIKYCVLTKAHIKQEEVKSRRDDTDSKSQQKAKSRRRRWCLLLKEDIDKLNGCESLRILYRNAVAHLNIPRNAIDYIGGIKKADSYFAIYHYMMQQYLSKKHGLPEGLGCTRGVYCKDLVKALNAPFGYNLPRFKNLSVEALFDMNEEPAPEGKE